MHTCKRNPNTTLKIVMKSQQKRPKEKGRSKKEQKHPENNEQSGNKYIPTNNYFKYKQTKCSNQRIQSMLTLSPLWGEFLIINQG